MGENAVDDDGQIDADGLVLLLDDVDGDELVIFVDEFNVFTSLVFADVVTMVVVTVNEPEEVTEESDEEEALDEVAASDISILVRSTRL